MPAARPKAFQRNEKLGADGLSLNATWRERRDHKRANATEFDRLAFFNTLPALFEWDGKLCKPSGQPNHELHEVKP